MAADYHINVSYSTEDECWIADIPDLRYCSAHGPAPQKALEELIAAKELWLDVAREHGDPIPPPRYQAPRRRDGLSRIAGPGDMGTTMSVA